MQEDLWRWGAPPLRPLLREGDVHLWRANLDLPLETARPLLGLLSADEQARMETIRSAVSRVEFGTTRALLRVILARYTKQESRNLRFRYNRYGKPALRHEPGEIALHFNVSHSSGTGLIAITCDREVGVDIQRVRAAIAMMQIAEHFLSPMEVRAVSALPELARYDMFYRCWTRKEAYAKARGVGLSLNMQGFAVPLEPGGAQGFLHASDAASFTLWSFRDIPVGAGYAAAVVIQGQLRQPTCWQFQI